MRRYFMVAMLIFGNTIFAMHNNILKATRLFTATVLIGGGVAQGIIEYKELQEPLEGKPMPRATQQFIRSIMHECGDPTADTLPLIVKSEGHWVSVNNKAIYAQQDDIDTLERALKYNDKDYKALTSMIVKHEVGHNIRKDSYQTISMMVVIPTTTVIGCSLLRRGASRMFNIKPPKKIISTALRSLVSVAMVLPKALFSISSLILFLKHQEREADRFACERANTQEELSFCYMFWMQEYINQRNYLLVKYGIDLFNENLFAQRILYTLIIDITHPLSLDRAICLKHTLISGMKSIKIKEFLALYLLPIANSFGVKYRF